jgi:hypothetical protein
MTDVKEARRDRKNCSLDASFWIPALALLFVAAAGATMALAQARAAVIAPRLGPVKATLPRLPSGEPALEGVWNFATMTPLERPTRFADRKFMTAQEAAEFAKEILDDRDGALMTGGPEWWDANTRLMQSPRTSLIIDPPEGRVPPLTADARERASARAKARGTIGSAESVEQLTLEERCLFRTSAGPPIVPGPYNNNLEFIQTRGYVVIFSEMIHDARIIAMDGTPHARVPKWQGDSRGRWDGDTLVVDTVNFTDKTAFRGATEGLHVVERFTRTDVNTVEYQFTVDDPRTWTRPWTAAFPLTKSNDLIYEYACHEGNATTVIDILNAARLQDKAK